MIKTLKNYQKGIKTFKIIIASLIGILILIDVVLVMLEQKCYPTFSWVIRDNRTNLIWLTFLYGGLVAKIFYNRKVKTPEAETKGFLIFVTFVILLFLLGRHCLIPMGTLEELLVLISGGLFSHGIWPQYVKKVA